MATFKCKMCGSPLEVEANQTVATCEYCLVQQTLPKLDDEKRANLYDRANHFRRNNEFDKAMGIYEQILNEDKTDAESYWSLVLCRYGIEYVEDPASHKRVPTVNRAQFTSIFDDDNYKSALEYADAYQKTIYEDEAKAINEIQKGILAISQKEEPFDVFICYKETDNNGRRTPDSVLANDLYHQLTQEGFKVFFARITLEDKLGSAYEPYIFAALNSAKIMVVLGTRPEYFNAVWVKNEWSRYLALVKNSNGKKMLIPAYKDMDPYDLPEEFSHLQAQDMSKLGFMQDLIRGIKKISQDDEPKTTVVKETVVTGGNLNIDTLLKRVFIFLEDKDWNSANEYCEKVLDIDPENAQAYLGKLMSELRVSNKYALKDVANPFDDRNNYQKVMRYGDAALKKEISDCVEFIRNRNENTRLNNAYNGAKNAMNSAASEEEFKRAADQFKAISEFKDSAALVDECLEKAEVARKDAIYKDANSRMTDNSVASYEQAIKLFNSIPGWKDSDDRILACKNKIEEIKAKEEADRIEKKRKAEEERLESERKAEAERIERERIAEENRKAAEVRAKKNKKLAMIITPIVAVVLAFVIVLTTVIIPNNKYNNAIALMEDGKYEEAITAFEVLDGYKDSEVHLKNCSLVLANQNLEQKNYKEALKYLLKADAYNELKDDISECWKHVVVRETISAGDKLSVGIKTDGTVVATGFNSDGECDVDDWTDIVDVSAGTFHTVGLKADGTVVSTQITEDESYNSGQCSVSGWSDIVAISAGVHHTIGLKSDGTVEAVGSNNSGQCNISELKEIIAISAGSYHSVGLKSDGTVVAIGDNGEGQCDVSGWTDIVAISANYEHTVGLKSDGTVVATEYTGDSKYYNGQCDVSAWRDIVAISAGTWHTVGLKSDGTVVAIGDNDYGQCDIDDWTDIVAISAGEDHTIGLKSDGTVVATEYTGDYYGGQCNVKNWSNIKTPESKKDENQTSENQTSVNQNSDKGKKNIENLNSAKTGDIVTFGSYEQDNDTSNGKEEIEWLVLDVKDNKALVISKYALDRMKYNTEDKGVTWETCTLREWLNNDFINAAFTVDEKAMIPTVTVSADEYEECTDPGNATQDKVFLLSITEVDKYLNSEDRRCEPTDFASNKGEYASYDWWLRTPGIITSTAAIIDSSGKLGIHRGVICSEAVRPAMWIEIE